METPNVGRAFRHVTVLGRAGQTFGLGFFASAKDLDKLHASPDPATFLEDEWTDPAPQSYAMGSREEAVVCVDELGDAWKATPSALEWLATHAPAGKRRKRHRR